VTIHPQQCTIHELRDAWRRADELGVDSIWFWDHFYPLYGDPDGNQFECWSLLAAAAIETRSPTWSHHRPALRRPLRARHWRAIVRARLPGVRLRVRRNQGSTPHTQRGVVAHQSANREPEAGACGPLPILIGGGGEKVTLRLVAEHAQTWNALGSADEYAQIQSPRRLGRKIDRDPKEIERSPT